MTNNYFDKVAKVWNTKERENRTFSIYKKIINIFEDGSEKNALEIGVGDGLLASLLAKDLKEIDCIDSSEMMREETDNRLEQLEIENVKVYDENYLEATLKKYDFIYSLTAFHHIVDIESELNLVKRHLKPNGKFILMDLDIVPASFHKDLPDFDGHDGFSREEMETYFRNVKFEPLNYEILWEGRKGEIDFRIFLMEGIVS